MKTDEQISADIYNALLHVTSNRQIINAFMLVDDYHLKIINEVIDNILLSRVLKDKPKVN